MLCPVLSYINSCPYLCPYSCLYPCPCPCSCRTPFPTPTSTSVRVRDDRPVHLLGIGGVRDIFHGVRQGIDTFDCVHPSRLGRHGGALVLATHWDEPTHVETAGSENGPKITGKLLHLSLITLFSPPLSHLFSSSLKPSPSLPHLFSHYHSRREAKRGKNGVQAVTEAAPDPGTAQTTATTTRAKD